MTWRLGESGGGPELQKRHGGILEELPRARAGVHRPPGVEMVQVRCGWCSRQRFECPSCGRSCRDLFELSTGWQCRLCGRLRYRSKREWDTNKQALANRLRVELGGQPGALSPLPPRPKTVKAARRYDRKVWRIRRLELGGLRDTAHVIRSAERFLKECERG